MAEASIFKDLESDHARHRQMLKQLSETQGDSAERRALFENLRKELQAHAAAEEESLYVTMLACPDLRENARHSVTEHKEIDDFLGALLKIDMASGAWLAKFKEMRRRYLHHVEEEEKEMFRAAAARLSEAAEQTLAEVFEKRKPRELTLAEKEMPGDEWE